MKKMTRSVLYSIILILSVLIILPIPEVQAQEGTITYSAPTMTVVGFSEGTPCTFWDLWNASDTNGWNVVFRNTLDSLVQYVLNCTLYIGDGFTPTYFKDTNVQVEFWDDEWNLELGVTDEAHLTFGELLDATDKTSGRGVQFINNGLSCFIGETGSEINLYSSSFSITEEGEGYYEMTLDGDGEIYNSIISSLSCCMLGETANYTFYNVLVTLNSLGFEVGATSLTWDIVRIVNCGSSVLLRSNVNITNLYSRNAGDETFYIYGYPTPILVNLINPDVDVWNFYWSGVSGVIYRQYTFDLTVTYPNGTGIQYANVTVSHYGQGETQDFTELTDSNGQISQKTLTMGFYNQTGGNTIYSYNPHHIEITNVTGYETYNGNFTLDEKTEWDICLCPESYNWFGVTLIIGLLACFMLVIVLTSKK